MAKVRRLAISRAARGLAGLEIGVMQFASFLCQVTRQIGPRQRVNPAVRLRRIQRQFCGRSNVGIFEKWVEQGVFSSCGGRIKSDRVEG